MYKVLITTVPFGDKDRKPLDLLESNGISYVINPVGRKLTEDELAHMVSNYDVIIAGTELITEKVMIRAKKLKLISRVGIGLDSVDLLAAEERKIIVSYTPDAPAPAVSELTLGIMITLLRMAHVSNLQMHLGGWNRYFGRRITNLTIGIIGLGRIGKGVLRHLSSFGSPRILINDIKHSIDIPTNVEVEMVDKEALYQEADVISLHVPLTAQTKNMIQLKQLMSMKSDAIIINTSRGGIINENDLANALESGHLTAAAIDVFEHEPYDGRLASIDNCLLTSHMGSMSIDCRTRMEIEATEEAIRFLNNKPLQSVVPKEEYNAQKLGL
jgi:D-3-phosphoglycerate dehydrogenase